MKKFSDIQNDEVLNSLLQIYNYSNVILEGSGLYKDCYNLAVFIYNKIYENLNEFKYHKSIIIYKDDVKEFDNIFFEELTIYNSKNIQYILKNRIGDTSRWNKEKKIFDYIDIEIDLSVKKDDFIALLVHELDHAFRDYKLHLNDSKLFIDSNYIKTKIDGNESEHENIMKNIKYYLYDFEMSAFISQIVSKLQNKKFASINKAYNAISKDNIFQNISLIYHYKNLINTDKNELELCKKAFKNIFDYDLKLNELNNKINKLYSKFINHVYLAVSKQII